MFAQKLLLLFHSFNINMLLPLHDLSFFSSCSIIVDVSVFSCLLFTFVMHFCCLLSLFISTTCFHCSLTFIIHSFLLFASTTHFCYSLLLLVLFTSTSFGLFFDNNTTKIRYLFDMLLFISASLLPIIQFWFSTFANWYSPFKFFKIWFHFFTYK